VVVVVALATQAKTAALLVGRGVAVALLPVVLLDWAGQEPLDKDLLAAMAVQTGLHFALVVVAAVLVRLAATVQQVQVEMVDQELRLQLLELLSLALAAAAVPGFRLRLALVAQVAAAVVRRVQLIRVAAAAVLALVISQAAPV